MVVFIEVVYDIEEKKRRCVLLRFYEVNLRLFKFVFGKVLLIIVTFCYIMQVSD